MNPKLTLITVCYNDCENLKSTIENVRELKYDNLDYIVIDGGSVDGTVDLIHQNAGLFKYWITEPDKGIYDAMNKGWLEADNDSFILYLGAGDKILNLPSIESFLHADIVFGDVFIGKYHFKSRNGFLLKLGNTIHHQALFIKKKLHLLPPFSLEYKVYSDFDFNQRLLKNHAVFVKDEFFSSFALEGGLSEKFNKKESLLIVNKNFGFLYKAIASFHYLLKDGKKLWNK